MAYNSYFPTGYQPFQYQQIQQPIQQPATNNGYLPVRSEDEARNYPVAPGNIMTFFDETKPYCYKKAMGASPLDRPVFEKYRIVKEEILEQKPEEDASVEVKQLLTDIRILKKRVKRLEERYEQPIVDLSADDEQSNTVSCEIWDTARNS